MLVAAPEVLLAGPTDSGSSTIATVTSVAESDEASRHRCRRRHRDRCSTVGRLAAAGHDAAVVLCVATDRGVVVLAVVDRGGVAAVGVLVDVAIGVVGGIVDVGLVAVRDRPAVVADEALVLAPEMPPDDAEPVLDEADWPCVVSLLPVFTFPPAPPVPAPPVAEPPLAVAGPDVAVPLWLI